MVDDQVQDPLGVNIDDPRFPLITREELDRMRDEGLGGPGMTENQFRERLEEMRAEKGRLIPRAPVDPGMEAPPAARPPVAGPPEIAPEAPPAEAPPVAAAPAGRETKPPPEDPGAFPDESRKKKKRDVVLEMMEYRPPGYYAGGGGGGGAGEKREGGDLPEVTPLADHGTFGFSPRYKMLRTMGIPKDQAYVQASIESLNALNRMTNPEKKEDLYSFSSGWNIFANARRNKDYDAREIDKAGRAVAAGDRAEIQQMIASYEEAKKHALVALTVKAYGKVMEHVAKDKYAQANPEGKQLLLQAAGEQELDIMHFYWAKDGRKKNPGRPIVADPVFRQFYEIREELARRGHPQVLIRRGGVPGGF